MLCGVDRTQVQRRQGIRGSTTHNNALNMAPFRTLRRAPPPAAARPLPAAAGDAPGRPRQRAADRLPRPLRGPHGPLPAHLSRLRPQHDGDGRGCPAGKRAPAPGRHFVRRLRPTPSALPTRRLRRRSGNAASARPTAWPCPLSHRAAGPQDRCQDAPPALVRTPPPRRCRPPRPFADLCAQPALKQSPYRTSQPAV